MTDILTGPSPYRAQLTRGEVLEYASRLEASDTVERWLNDGRGVVIFENGDMSHSACFERLLWPLDAGDSWPQCAPNGSWGLGWRYLPRFVHAGFSAPIPDDAPDWARVPRQWCGECGTDLTGMRTTQGTGLISCHHCHWATEPVDEEGYTAMDRWEREQEESE